MGAGKARSSRRFIGAPSPEAIAWLACGRSPSKKHVSATVNRILPVIIDGAVFPEDIVNSCVVRVFPSLQHGVMGMGESAWDFVFVV